MNNKYFRDPVKADVVLVFTGTVMHQDARCRCRKRSVIGWRPKRITKHQQDDHRLDYISQDYLTVLRRFKLVVSTFTTWIRMRDYSSLPLISAFKMANRVYFILISLVALSQNAKNEVCYKLCWTRLSFSKIFLISHAPLHNLNFWDT